MFPVNGKSYNKIKLYNNIKLFLYFITISLLLPSYFFFSFLENLSNNRLQKSNQIKENQIIKTERKCCLINKDTLIYMGLA